MKPRTIIILFVIAALIQSCDLPGLGPQPTQVPATELPSAIPADTATQELSTATQIVEASPTPPPDTATPQSPLPTQNAVPTLAPPAAGAAMVTPIQDPVNCRFGPGTVFESIGVGLSPGKSSRIVGKNGDASYWQIMNPDGLGDVCWVAASVVTASGDLSSIQVAPTPVSFVDDVSVTVDPTDGSTSTCFSPGEFRYAGTINVNGPVTVKWHWVSSKNNIDSSTKTTVFTTSGPKSFADTFHISAKGYSSVKLIVTSPNNITGEDVFKVGCS